jgi:large subunit ribosomal protein L18
MKILRRRRKEGKTNYKSRLALLKSGLPRLIIRKSNLYIMAQIVESKIAQDKVIIGNSTKDLISKGWATEKLGSLKSLPAAYLLGFIIGTKSKDRFNEVIVDIGLNRHIPKSRICAVVKGALDSGLNILHSSSALPEMELIKSNKALSSIFEKVKENI